MELYLMGAHAGTLSPATTPCPAICAQYSTMWGKERETGLRHMG